ncbi:MAG: S1C family serine protease [Fimbriiglobus sp.]
MTSSLKTLALLALGIAAFSSLALVQAQVDPIVTKAEQERIAAINKVRPAVVAVCFYGGEACGSGVLIDPEGYALTNFHVVQPTGNILQCGLADGKLYDAVVVGLDKVGDVALIKMLPKKPGEAFPYVKLGDSDNVRMGDWSLAMGNPFGLSLDFTPTVTYGLVSGVNRYQPPAAKGTLEYTDCIQIETSINPGNSGGPLFNMQGELIGINGRGSFEKRGRVNSGVGYAISINQIKNFLGHFMSGLDTDHATLGALVETENEDGDLSRMLVKEVLDDADVAKRGVRPGDQLVSFAGRPLTSVNQYKNILGVFPRDWRMPLSYRRGTETKETLVRLMGNMDAEPDNPIRPPMPPKGPAPKGKPGVENSPAKKLFIEKKGYANFYFNKQRQDTLRQNVAKQGDFAARKGNWEATGTLELADRRGDVKLTWKDDTDGLTEVKITRNGIEDAVKPLKPGTNLGELQLPQGSGGMLSALYQYRRLLTQWKEGFEIGFDHGGQQPIYPMPADGKTPERLKDLRVDCEVLRTKHGPFETKWFYSLKDQQLLSCESILSSDENPCELFFADYRTVDGLSLPHRIEIRMGDKRYGVLTIQKFQLDKK